MRLLDLGICGISHIVLLYVVYLLFRDSRSEMQRLREVLGSINLPVKHPLSKKEE